MSLKPVLFVAGSRTTIREHLALYRAAKAGPLSYVRVAVEPCHGCGVSRPDDGTPCQFCGAYKHCVYQSRVGKDTSAETAAISASSTRRGRPSNTKPTKLVNPRRKNRNDS